MTHDVNMLPIVDERMIDILLIELLHTDQAFREWFAEGVLPGSGYRLRSVRHSVFETSSGETDVETVWSAADGNVFAVLVENKISAAFMAMQLERYRMRGEEGVTAGRWENFRVVLLAPASYLSGLRPGEKACIDAEIAYEDILGWLGSDGREAFSFKRLMLAKAIDSARKSYVKTLDVAMTEFWRSYWNLLRESGSEVTMDEPVAKGRDSSWIEFRLPWQAGRARLYHKFKKQTVELVIPSRDPGRAEELLAPFLGEGMTYVPTKSTASVCINVPAVDHRMPLGSQTDGIARAVSEAARLQALAVSPEFRAVAAELAERRFALAF